MLHALWNFLILTGVVFGVSRLLPGVRLERVSTAFVVAGVYSLVNALLGFVLKILAFPLIILTFGLAIFVINALMLWVTDQLIEDFEIRDLPTTLVASLLISVASTLLQWIF